MPELPEVEIICQQLCCPSILYVKIAHVAIYCHKLRYEIPQNLPNLLINDNFHKIQRRGKYILLFVSKGVVLIHLGMSGKLLIRSENSDLLKHEHVRINFVNEMTLSFVDPRRFGLVLWIDYKHDVSENLHRVNNNDMQNQLISHHLLDVLGIEPLSHEFSAKYLFDITRNKKTEIKTFLMNSHIIVGIGNIYASEVLFACRLHPKLHVAMLHYQDCVKLVSAIKNILHMAISQGGTTIKDFMSSNGEHGAFVNKLMVYGREGLPCYVCGTPIQMFKQSQRSTFFCPQCQCSDDIAV